MSVSTVHRGVAAVVGNCWRCLPPVSREPRSCSAANNSSYLDETMMLEFPKLPCDLVRGVDWSIIICSVS
jgi:hypothetical protein